jgi:hypothetical protein
MGLPVGRIFMADINHRRQVVLINVTKLAHTGYPPMRYISTLLSSGCSSASGLRNSL